MPYFLLISYAVSVWMCVDAYNRGMQGWWFIIILVPLGEWIYFFAVKFQDFELSSGPFTSGKRFRCSDCQYCVGIYRNGCRCQIRDEAVFKTPTHIQYCASYSPVPRER